MTYRQEKTSYYCERWLVFQAILTYLGEIRNYRAYAFGKMGVITSKDSKHLDDRVQTALDLLEKRQCNLDELFKYYLSNDLEWGPNDYDLILQYSLINESAMYMWRRGGRFVEDKQPLEHLVGSYKYAKRQLRRYKIVSRDNVKLWLPENFKLEN